MDARRRASFSRGRTAPLRTAKSCGPDTPTLVSSRREMIAPARGARKPGSPKSAKDTVKTIAQGRPDVRPDLW
jgi:hypothetical protein